MVRAKVLTEGIRAPSAWQGSHDPFVSRGGSCGNSDDESSDERFEVT